MTRLNDQSHFLAGICLPDYRFTYYWTLSSKFFATFPHGTCLLSVWWTYLALAGVYLLLQFALSSKPTLCSKQRFPLQGVCMLWVSHPLWSSIQGDLHTLLARIILPKLNAAPSLSSRKDTFAMGLSLFTRRLLGESLLFSFPPLNDMLKFSGYFRLIRGR